jgi:hypothetical protein
MPSDFPGAFSALRRILKKHSGDMIVQADAPNEFTLVTRAIGPNKKPLWFGAVYAKKSAVTFHLMPLYYNPKLGSKVASELKPRMQGKACFNFQRPDAELFSSLDAALKSGGADLAAIARERKATAARATAKRKATLAKRSKAVTGATRARRS